MSITKKDLIRKFPNFNQREVSDSMYWCCEDTEKLIAWINKQIVMPQHINDRIEKIRDKLSRLSVKIKGCKIIK